MSAMEFVAVTKTGIHVYDAFAKEGSIEPVTSLPAATNAEGYVSTNAEGYAWSADGAKLATVDKGVAVVWDAAKAYKRLGEVTPSGTSGGVRALRFSPGGSFLTTYEKHDKEKCPENMQVWDLRSLPDAERLRSQAIRGYSSGAISVETIQWTADESACLELKPGEGLLYLDAGLRASEPRTVIPEPHAVKLHFSPKKDGDSYLVCCYMPEAAGRAAEVAIYSLGKPATALARLKLPSQLKDVSMTWNFDGTALLVLASSDVDPTGASYFGTTSLFWLRTDGKSVQKICGPEDGLVQDFSWSPNANEFLVIVGMLPATISLYNGKTGKHEATFGKSRRNTVRWCPFGRFLVVGGFGALPGDVDFFDRSCQETVCSFRAALTVNCAWAPDGRHWLACTTAPRMNEDNQVSIFHYTSARKHKIDFKPAGSGGTGKKACDAGAMLFAASWRPHTAGKFQDRPATPREGGAKRAKGLPSEGAAAGAGASAPKVAAYRPAAAARGGGSSIAAMMRGEVEAPATSSSAPSGPSGDRWGEPASGGLTAEEIRVKLKEQKDAEKAAKKAEEEAIRLAKEAGVKAAKKNDADERKLEKLKKELVELQETLQEVNSKEWDELTEEDEALLESETELRTKILELEKKLGPA